jgi:hypothetical protein
MDQALVAALVDPSFRLLLLPLQGSGTSTPRADNPSRKRDRSFSPEKSGSKKQQQRIEELQRQLKAARSGGGKGGKDKGHKGKGGKDGGKGRKSKGKNRSAPNMPNELRGKAYETDAKEPLCFGFNMAAGCNKAKPGEKCERGWHLCCEHGCFGTHPILQHV